MSGGRKRALRIDQLERRRLEAGALFEKGASTVEVARRFGVAWRTAFKWRQAYNARGLDGLRSRGLPGREPLLDATRRRRLRTILRAGAVKSGFPDEVWTLARVHAVTERVFGLTCSRISIWRMLRQSKSTAGIATRAATRSALRAGTSSSCAPVPPGPGPA